MHVIAQISYFCTIHAFCTNCAPLAADCFYFVRGFILSVSDHYQADVIEAFSPTYFNRCLTNIDNPYFEQMLNQTYFEELRLNMANYFDIEAFFWTWTCP